MSAAFSKTIYSVNMTKIYVVFSVGHSFTSDCREWTDFLELETFLKLDLTGEI